MTALPRRPAVSNLLDVARPIRSAHEHVTVAAVNDDRMILAVNTEPYPWHEHPDSDELLIVLEGTLRLDVAGCPSVDLGPFDLCVVRAGEVHRTRPDGRCVNLVFKRATGGTSFIDERT